MFHLLTNMQIRTVHAPGTRQNVNANSSVEGFNRTLMKSGVRWLWWAVDLIEREGTTDRQESINRDLLAGW